MFSVRRISAPAGSRGAFAWLFRLRASRGARRSTATILGTLGPPRGVRGAGPRRRRAGPSRRIGPLMRRVSARVRSAGRSRGWEHLVAQLHALVDELRTLADPDAAEAQIETVTTD